MTNSEMYSLIWSIAGTVFSVAGLCSTIYFERKARKLAKEKISLNWNDVRTGGQYLAKEIKQYGFIPDIVLTPSIRGAMIAGIVVLEFDDPLPVYTCLQRPVTTSFSFEPQGYTKLETSKWSIYIPNIVSAHPLKKILIIDDFVMSGIALKNIRETLKKFGFQDNSVRAAALVCTTQAKDSNMAPEFWWHESPTSRFYFPWGQSR